MFHVVGLLERYRSEHERFEIDGANAARAFLERHGLPEAGHDCLAVDRPARDEAGAELP
jgi:hypothetical protein